MPRRADFCLLLDEPQLFKLHRKVIISPDIFPVIARSRGIRPVQSAPAALPARLDDAALFKELPKPVILLEILPGRFLNGAARAQLEVVCPPQVHRLQ